MFKQTLTVALLGLSAFAASADPITPTFTTFGTLGGATFGGSGIPNDAVAITEVAAIGQLPMLTLGLTAHQRYGNNPALANDGAGIFTAQTGIDTNAPSSLVNPYGLWNFGFYASGNLAAYTFVLSYDFDPAAGNDASTHGTVTVPGLALFGATTYQDTWNLGMDFLAISGGGVAAPTGAFDPTVAGQYTFSLTAYTGETALVFAGTTAIQVNVVQAVPEPTSLALVGAALLGLAAARRRKA